MNLPKKAGEIGQLTLEVMFASALTKWRKALAHVVHSGTQSSILIQKLIQLVCSQLPNNLTFIGVGLPQGRSHTSASIQQAPEDWMPW